MRTLRKLRMARYKLSKGQRTTLASPYQLRGITRGVQCTWPERRNGSNGTPADRERSNKGIDQQGIEAIDGPGSD